MTEAERIFGELDRVVAEAALEDLPAKLGRLEQAKATGWARLLASPGPKVPAPEPERFVTAQEAADIAGVSVDRIYTWAKGRPWASRPSRRCLRIREQAFRRWLASRTA